MYFCIPHPTPLLQNADAIWLEWIALTKDVMTLQGIADVTLEKVTLEISAKIALILSTKVLLIHAQVCHQIH